MKKEFQSVVFDDENKKLSILIGTCGDVSYSDIEKASIANEDAKFKGKSAPFAHQVFRWRYIYEYCGRTQSVCRHQINIKRSFCTCYLYF